MRKFYRENTAKVAALVKDGQEAVENVHSVMPKLGRMMFFHAQDTKQALTDLLKKTRESHGIVPDRGTQPIAEADDGGNNEDGDSEGGNNDDGSSTKS